jgi:uncharacterized RDD family membrane protein YckC
LAPSPAPAGLRTPGLRRRMACFAYEGVLLFAVVTIAAYLFSSLAQQRHALTSRSLLQFYLFVVLAIYFVWFWTHGGQTLAMKTWRIRLLARDGAPVSQGRALARYCLSWLWFLPALLVAWAVDSAQLWVPLVSLAFGILGYAALSFAHPDRQFLHDALCKTRLVSTNAATSG